MKLERMKKWERELRKTKLESGRERDVGREIKEEIKTVRIAQEQRSPESPTLQVLKHRDFGLVMVCESQLFSLASASSSQALWVSSRQVVSK